MSDDKQNITLFLDAHQVKLKVDRDKEPIYREAANPGLTYNDYFEYSNLNRSFGHFDVDWDVAISYQFLKVLNVTLSTSMKYYPGTLIEDKNGVQKERIQFKSVLGVGIGYSF